MFINPFTPNFGQIPRYLAGRDFVINDIERYLQEGLPGNPSRSSILIGARGTGKTALLTYFSEFAQRHGWISVDVTCVPGMQEDILQQTQAKAASIIETDKKTHLTGISVGELFGLSWESEKDPGELNWRSKMSRILDKLAEQDIGLFLTIDEVNPNLEEMVQAASVYQLWVREGKKIAILMAGLPGLVLALLNDRSVSFLRRSTQYEIGKIADHEIELAFKKTVEESGKHIPVQVLQTASDAIDGYPYMMQLVGYRAWQQSGDELRITLSAMREGIALARKDFEYRVLRTTMSELSNIDRAFLKAMLEDPKETSVADLEKRLCRSSGFISRYRGRLIAQGVIAATRRGYLEFALPGMREFLNNLAETDLG